MQSTLTPTETDPHDIFVIEPDVVLAARADQTPAPAVDPVSHPVAPQAETTRDVAAAVSVPTVDTTFRATAGTAAPATGETRAPEIAVPSDIHLAGRPPRGRWMTRAILGFVFAIGAAAASAAWDHYGDTAKTMIANWTPFVLTPQASQAVAKPAIAEQPNSSDTQGSAQASATGQAPAAAQAATTDQAAAPSAPAAQPVAGTAQAAAAAPPPPSAAPDIAAMSQQIEALKASIEQLKAGQQQLSQQMAQQMAKETVRETAKETARSNAARKLSALAAQPAPAPAHRPRPAFSPAMAAAALASSRPPAPPQAAYRALPQPAAVPPPPYQPRAQIVDQADVDADTVVRPPMPLR
jgi:hypothetical protein